MVIRKYIAVNEEEATKLAKNDLGNDVVIMNVKESAPRGLARFFKRASVEVTAAVDEKKEEAATPDFSKLQEAIKETNAVLAANENSKASESDAERDTLTNINAMSSSLLADSASATVSYRENKEEKREIEERLSNLQDLLEKQMQVSQNEKEEEDQENTNQAYFDLIRKKLVDNEVEPTYIDQIFSDISDSLSKNANLENILAGVYQKIVLKIGQPHLIDIKTRKTKYIFFVGPTGVGKTTTIAKIASTLKLTKKTKIALITSDTYRIAAVDQLKTYANILGIPLQVVYAPQDMKQAMEELTEFDLVFVDTAGRSHNNAEQKEDIQKLLETVDEANREVFLVLSATTKYKDLVRIAQTYSEITKYNLIFTKLDETETIGSLYNIHMLTGAPLSYMTWGQNVPDDIGKIDAQSIAKKLLGGNS